jgi:hypothetical protein
VLLYPSGKKYARRPEQEEDYEADDGYDYWCCCIGQWVLHPYVQDKPACGVTAPALSASPDVRLNVYEPPTRNPAPAEQVVPVRKLLRAVGVAGWKVCGWLNSQPCPKEAETTVDDLPRFPPAPKYLPPYLSIEKVNVAPTTQPQTRQCQRRRLNGQALPYRDRV